MVNFGGHLKAVRDEDNKGTHLYLVPYNEIKRLLHEKEGVQATFTEHWKLCLQQACADNTKAMTELWQTVFDGISESSVEQQQHQQVRGAPLALALELYCDEAGLDASHELLTRMVHVQTAALTNAEALRKLVKKYDKHHQPLLSSQLLPMLYASNLLAAQAVLEDTMGILRALVETDSELEEIDNSFVGLVKRDSEARHEKSVERRMGELDWLKRLVESIPETKLRRLVAHRGFHHVKDRNDKRPLENSLAAYETAYSCGVFLCECDIALTKDEKLVLAHDDDFKRLALDSKSAASAKRVSDLTLKEIMGLALTSGNRPPLLIDVLRSAHAISDHAKLIIEIKPGNAAAASALARLLWRHPDLCNVVEMIMSFDAVTMHRLRAEFALWERAMAKSTSVGGSLTAAAAPAAPAPAPATGADSGFWAPRSSVARANAPLGSHHRIHSRDHFGGSFAASTTGLSKRLSLAYPSYPSNIGLSISQTSLSQMANREGEVPVVVAQEQPAAQHHQSSHKQRLFPKLMLLTVAAEPKRACEMRVGVGDLSPVEGWLNTRDGSGSLDGVYLQYQPEMMTAHGAAAMKALGQRFDVGVWSMSGEDPDCWDTFRWLVEQGDVSFVNTDLPTNFRDDVELEI